MKHKPETAAFSLIRPLEAWAANANKACNVIMLES
jgi:hypothetical protein